MDAGVLFALVMVVLVLVGVAAFWIHMRRHDHPETTASHDSRPMVAGRDDARIPPYPGTDRPAGPAAEAMAVPEPGETTPAPDADIRP